MHRHKIQSRQSIGKLLQYYNLQHHHQQTTSIAPHYQQPCKNNFSHFSTSFFVMQQQQQASSTSTSMTTTTTEEESSSSLLNKKYSQTLILPSTTFSMRANSVETEPKLQEICSKQLYTWQQQNLSNEKKFVLHDGPPYANGSLHMGHALNKILKDFVNRYKLLRGHKVHYIPGWDCHGLPIEMKAIHQGDDSSSKMSPTEIRRLAREFAEETIQRQRKDFERWGIMGDWDNYYTTMHPLFEARQLEVFLSMYRNGHIYRGARPVYWSPSSRTALAEAELEYPEAHTSKSIYIIFPVVSSSSSNRSNKLNQWVSLEGGLHVAVWTTTPWTLMANEAVCFHNDIKYSVVRAVNKHSASVKHFLVADDLLDKFMEKTGVNYEYTKVDSVTGGDLEGHSCEHPFVSGKIVPLLHGPHVTTEIGTGFVHTAPGHGMEDFLIGKQHNLPVTSPVDDVGCYTTDVIVREFAGKNVFTDGNDGVIQLLKEQPGERLLLLENYVHKYPYDWRTKKPILIRTTKQWFADLSHLKDTANAALDSVQMIPEVGRHRLTSFIKARSEWCISRQRVWGVPIPVFYNKQNPDEYLATETSIQHVITLFEKHGADCWWSLPIEELLAPEYRSNGVEYVRGTDTLDVWFDSGTTWYGVIERHGESTPVDLYLEGSDQHRGWFQSSLLTSIAFKGQAPYKSVLTHGFVLDEHSRKMSKSLGNIFEPSTIVDGKSEQQLQKEAQQQQQQQESTEEAAVNMDELSEREKKKLLKKQQKQKAAEKRQAKLQSASPAYGADVLRLWASLFDYTSDVSIGNDVIGNVFETLKKIRNTERFLLGNLSDFSVEQRLPYGELSSLDRYMLLKLHEFLVQVESEYERYAFHKVHQLIVSFTFAISSFYLDVIKDRLYLEPRESKSRKGCQTVVSYIFENYNKVIAPIVCHLAEDAYQHSTLKTEDRPSVFTTGWFTMEDTWNNETIRQHWDHIIKFRTEAYKLIEQARTDKLFSTASESRIEVRVECSATKQALDDLAPGEIEEVMIVSEVEQTNEVFECNEHEGKYVSQYTTPNGGTVHMRVSRARNHKCPRCWKHVAPAPGALCKRCDDVVANESFRL